MSHIAALRQPPSLAASIDALRQDIRSTDDAIATAAVQALVFAARNSGEHLDEILDRGVWGAQPLPVVFDHPSQAALALLNSRTLLTRRAGSFLGQLVADRQMLTEAQRQWLAGLLARAGLPPLNERA